MSLFNHPQYSSEHPLRLQTRPDDFCASPLHLSLALPRVPLLFIQSANPFRPPFSCPGTSVPDPTPGVAIESISLAISISYSDSHSCFSPFLDFTYIHVVYLPLYFSSKI